MNDFYFFNLCIILNNQCFVMVDLYFKHVVYINWLFILYTWCTACQIACNTYVSTTIPSLHDCVNTTVLSPLPPPPLSAPLFGYHSPFPSISASELGFSVPVPLGQASTESSRRVAYFRSLSMTGHLASQSNGSGSGSSSAGGSETRAKVRRRNNSGSSGKCQ